MSGHRQQAAPPTGDRRLRHATPDRQGPNTSTNTSTSTSTSTSTQGTRKPGRYTEHAHRKHHRREHPHTHHRRAHRPAAHHEPARRDKADSCAPGSSAAVRGGPSLNPGSAAATTTTSRTTFVPASQKNIYSLRSPPTPRSVLVPASHSSLSSSVSPSDSILLPSLSSHPVRVPERSRQRPLASSVEPSLPYYSSDHRALSPQHSPASSHASSQQRLVSSSPPLPPLPLRRNDNNTTDSTSKPHPPATMVSGGRIVCVAFPFVLAVASIITLLVAVLSGVTQKDNYVFRVNTTNLSINPSSLSSLLDTRAADAYAAGVAGVGSRAAAPAIKKRDFTFHDPSFLKEKTTTTTTTTSTSSNITAADLNLGLVYDVNLWGYCETLQNGTRTCTKPEYDWASKVFNNSEHTISSLLTASGQNITLPTEITGALKAYSALNKWTEVVFFIAFVALALEILVGLFTACSRVISCLTFLVAGFTSVIVVAAAAMSTAMAVVVVGAVEGTAKWYGVTAKFGTNYLIIVWLAAAFAVVAGFFWMFSICCCKPESRSSRRAASAAGGKRHLDDKHASTGSYQPLNDPNESGYYNNAYAPQYGPRAPAGARSDLAYEPYSHSRV